MAFVPRTFEQIRDDMINYLKAQTYLTDFEVGSVIRTIVEAAALEDDEQYFQMVQLLDAFSIQTATGADLDRRVADFNITRIDPVSSSGKIVIQNELLVKTSLAFASVSGATTLQLQNTAEFPTAGYPYTIRVGEGTSSVEDLQVSNNNLITNVLTLVAGAANSHSIGQRVAVVTGAADQLIPAGVLVQAPSLLGSFPINFVTTETGTLVNGNYESVYINARAAVAGIQGNVGINQIVNFSSAPPFTGAGVRNPVPFVGGRELETDTELRDRARKTIQSLSKGTVLALQQSALGVADPVTGQSVKSSNVLEDFINDEVIIYIDDGTGFTPDVVALAIDSLAVGAGAGAGSITVVDASKFPTSGYLFLSSNNIAVSELVKFTAVNTATNVITLAVPTVNAHALNDSVTLVDVLTLSAEPATKFLQTQNFPIVRSSPEIWIDRGSGFALAADPADYFLNKGTGEIELVSPLSAGNKVIASYNYYTGLVKSVQDVIDGKLSDPVGYPGVRAAGIVALVETPVIRRITVRLSIVAQYGYTESNLAPAVRSAIETYISGLGIGSDVIVAEIIQQAMSITGVYNVIVVSPASDLVILQNELPVPFDSSGNSLVSVT
jgi:uncharacterized phage protein gp47/JayE